MRIRDPEWKQFGYGILDGKKFGSGIRDKHPGSATLTILFLLFTGIVGQPDQEETVTVAAATPGWSA
jgi:hypothetical protein